MQTTQAAPDTPAIAGGKPAKTTPYAKQKRYGDAELNELREAIEQGTLFYAQGKKTFQLEKDYAAYCGATHTVACSSGTAAIHSACIAAGISPGDEVIVAPITDLGTVLPVMWQGATPVFADLDPRTYNMSPQSIQLRITERTKAIIAVHLAGNACDLKAIQEICNRHKLVLIEDCAQAFGCKYDGKSIGTIGEVGCFSLNEFKHISCGDGGLVITNDDATAKKLRLATDKGYDRSPGVAMRDPTFLANNYRITELQSAVAIAQLKKLDSIVQRRHLWCTRLTERIENLPGVLVPKITEGCNPSWWFYMMRVDVNKLGAHADDFAQALKAEGVPAAAHYIKRCVGDYPLFADHMAFTRASNRHSFSSYDYRANKCPVAQEILDTCVIVSVNEGYNDHDLDETVAAFERVVKWLGNHPSSHPSQERA